MQSERSATGGVYRGELVQLRVTVPCPRLQLRQAHALPTLQLHHRSDFLTPGGIWGPNYSHICKSPGHDPVGACTPEEDLAGEQQGKEKVGREGMGGGQDAT
ncbi:hypothetical protein EYF80_009246 [Liparis tanakae]|uniref:Uncharacterized protein n=1 Tax=Liparis tanakae TaxID=230148 RepID=A0A4Z2IRW7_9TELE|nr:hypothetical protein EYF80_009246 [Liparis tanakae]